MKKTDRSYPARVVRRIALRREMVRQAISMAQIVPFESALPVQMYMKDKGAVTRFEGLKAEDRDIFRMLSPQLSHTLHKLRFTCHVN